MIYRFIVKNSAIHLTKFYDERSDKVGGIFMILTKKMTVLKRTLFWLIAITLIFFLLLVLIIWDFKHSTSDVQGTIYSLILSFIIGAIIVISIIIIIMRSFLKPINVLIEKTSEIANGNYNIHFNVKKYDFEWQLLMNSFNQMSDVISQKVEMLTQQNSVLLIHKNQIEELNLRLGAKIESKSLQLQQYISTVDQYVITSQTNKYGIITYASEAFCNISGYTKKQLIGQNHRIIRHPDMAPEFFEELWKTISSGNIWHGEIKNRNSNGGFYWVDTTITPMIENGEIQGYTAIRHDISDKKIIEELAITDSMTGLYNRRFYVKTINEEMNRIKRHGSTLSLLMMDVDNFKAYNDTYGHQAGDDVLVRVAGILKSYTSRSGEYAFRLGGEEFGVLLSNMDDDESYKLAQQIRMGVESLNIPHINNTAIPVVTISIGIASYTQASDMSCDELYQKADSNLYTAKEHGRNQVVQVN